MIGLTKDRDICCVGLCVSCVKCKQGLDCSVCVGCQDSSDVQWAWQQLDVGLTIPVHSTDFANSTHSHDYPVNI